MSNRPAIPASITRALLLETGHRCAVCGTPCPLESAHIIPWHKSKEHKLDDLICLCANCHGRADKERWGSKTLREYKQRPWVSRQYEPAETALQLTTELQITIDMEREDFDAKEERWIQYAIAAFLGISPEAVRVVAIQQSSIKVIIALPSNSALRLWKAYQSNDPELTNYLAPQTLLDMQLRQADQEQKYAAYHNLERRIAFCYSAISDLREVIRKIAGIDFPSEIPLEFLRLLERILDVQENSLNKYRELIKQPQENSYSEPTVQRLILKEAQIGARLAQFIDFVEPASTENIPWGLASQLGRFCRRFRPGSQLILTSTWQFGYSITYINRILFRVLMGKPEFDTLLTDLPNYVVLSIPRTERNNSLQHAVLGRECAHLLDWALAQELSLGSEYGHSGNWRDRYSEISLSEHLASEIISDRGFPESLLTLHKVEGSYAAPTNRQESREIIHKTHSALASWVTTIVVDLLSIRLFGPAALFAFNEIAESLSELGRMTGSHPSAALRMRVMIEELGALSFIDLRNEDEAQKQWGDSGSALYREIRHIYRVCLETQYRETEDLDSISIPYLDEALDDRALDSVRAFIRNLDRDYFLDAVEFRTDVRPLVECLSRGLPPSKIELTPSDPIPASLPAILNAGWLYWLNTVSMAAEHSAGEFLHIRRLINALVYKALEASEIQWQYIERKAMAEAEGHRAL